MSKTESGFNRSLRDKRAYEQAPLTNFTVTVVVDLITSNVVELTMGSIHLCGVGHSEEGGQKSTTGSMTMSTVVDSESSWKASEDVEGCAVIHDR